MGFTILDTIDFRGLQLANLFITIHGSMNVNKRTYEMYESYDEMGNPVGDPVRNHTYSIQCTVRTYSCPTGDRSKCLHEEVKYFEVPSIPACFYSYIYQQLKLPYTNTQDDDE